MPTTSTEMSDASNRLQDKFNNPIVQSEPGFFTNTEFYMTNGETWGSNENNPAYPDREYIIYWGYNYSQCVEHEELNFYLNYFDYIKNQIVPSNKDFASVNVLDDVIGGEGTTTVYCHTYKIFWGDFHPYGGGGTN